MTSCNISKQIHQLWVKAGIYNEKSIPKNLNTNIIRKSIKTNLSAHI